MHLDSHITPLWSHLLHDHMRYCYDQSAGGLSCVLVWILGVVAAAAGCVVCSAGLLHLQGALWPLHDAFNASHYMGLVWLLPLQDVTEPVERWSAQHGGLGLTLPLGECS